MLRKTIAWRIPIPNLGFIIQNFNVINWNMHKLSNYLWNQSLCCFISKHWGFNIFLISIMNSPSYSCNIQFKTLSYVLWFMTFFRCCKMNLVGGSVHQPPNSCIIQLPMKIIWGKTWSYCNLPEHSLVKVKLILRWRN